MVGKKGGLWNLGFGHEMEGALQRREEDDERGVIINSGKWEIRTTLEGKEFFERERGREMFILQVSRETLSQFPGAGSCVSRLERELPKPQFIS